MEQLIYFLRGCLLTSFAAMHITAFPNPAAKTAGLVVAGKFTLPDWVVSDTVINEISWQGLPMEIEFFTIPKSMDQFLLAIATLIPEGSILSKSLNSYEISWVMHQTSYVLMVEPHASRDALGVKGILSSIELFRQEEERTHNTTHCGLMWLPDDVKLVFSMGDKVGGVKQARIDGYISHRSSNEVRSIIHHRLKKHGWISLAEYPLRSQSGSSTLLEVVCGNKHARIEIQKKALQTRISVMSIEQ